MAQAAVSKRSDQLYKGVKFGVRGEFLFIKLPSGRLLAYHRPRCELVITPWGKEKMAVTYMGLTAQKTWMRLTLTPNRLIENIVSAICRDLLMHSMLVIERDGRVKPVLSVHDEAVAYGEPDVISKHDYEQLMATVPEWAINDQGIRFPLESEGYIAKRYRK
jgi:DNA polymerase